MKKSPQRAKRGYQPGDAVLADRMAAYLLDNATVNRLDLLAHPLPEANRKRVGASADLAAGAAAKLAKTEDEYRRFSAQTRTSFTSEFADVSFPTVSGNLEPHYHLPPAVISLFLQHWIPQVVMHDSVLRYGSNEKVKYFPIMSLIGSIAMLSESQGSVSIESSVVPVASEEPEPEAMPTESEYTEEIVITSEKLRELFRFIGHEERIGRGFLEFMIFKSKVTNLIESLIEVKHKLPSANDILVSDDSPVWQLFCELCRAMKKNAPVGPSEIWGALTDESTWYFALLSKAEDGSCSIRMSERMDMHNSRENGRMMCTEKTRRVTEFLFTLVRGTSAAPDAFSCASRMSRTINKLKVLTENAVMASLESYSEVSMPARLLTIAEEKYEASIKNQVAMYKMFKGKDATLADCISMVNADVELVTSFFEL